MNNYDWLSQRHRNRHLFIVEGNHEKNEFIRQLLICFPEIDISIDNVIIYGTNIYQLYQDIEINYPGNWWEQDVDLPMIVSRKKNYETFYKNDFTNVLIIFDYEHHDPNFSEDKITKMQRYFHEVTDVGQLYLNYPMIESYQDFDCIPDSTFMNKKVSVTMQTGAIYKNSITGKYVEKMIAMPKKIKEILLDRFSFKDVDRCESCVRRILSTKNSINLREDIGDILLEDLVSSNLVTAKYQIAHKLNEVCLIKENESYFMSMRKIFQYIVKQNILKSYRIQMGTSELEPNYASEIYYNIDFNVILSKQNELSNDILTGYIWVLNTSMLFVPEYNIELMN
ncbi:hypothetical protein AN1V17_08100 [Vallitalea sediminicola]